MVTQQQIKETVASVINEYGTRNPWKIAAELDIEIMMFPKFNKTKGYCIKIDGNKFIVLNAHLDKNLQTFILAHELGHIFLHSDYNICFIKEHTYYPISKFETQATKFALELLEIPEENLYMFN